MNKIVREHYPASALPEDLRKGIARHASVTVTVEEEATRQPMKRDELLATLRAARERTAGISIEEATTRIRQLRDEWED